jgi:uncharacterized membrane protein (UPF0127 family)
MFKKLLLIGLLSLCSCAMGGNYVEIKGHKIRVEVVEDVTLQQLGLMFRRELAEDAGMLFIYPGEQTLSFWMKNTKIPLDIIYFDAGLRLVTLIDTAKPCRADPCRNYPATRPAMYVLEVNGGLAKQWDLKPGDELELHLE